MSLTGDPDGSALPGRHLGLRRDGRACTPPSASWPPCTTGTATGRGQHVEVNLLSSALVRPGQPVQRGRRRRRRPDPDGQLASQPLPVRRRCPTADGDLIVTAGNDGQFRRLCEVLGVPELADDPRFRPQSGPHGQPRGAAPAARGAAADPDGGRVVPRPHRRRGPVRADQHGRRWRGLRRGASASTPSSGSGPTAVPSVRQPDHVLRSRRPGTACRRRTSTSTGRRSVPGSPTPRLGGRRERAPRRRTEHERPTYPTSLGTSDADSIRLLGQDLAARSDGQGGVRRARLLAASPAGGPRSGEVRVFEAVLVALADHGFTPTAIAARLTYLSAPPTRCRARWPPVCSAVARASSGSPRTPGGSSPRRWPRTTGPLPTDDDGWDALALDVVRRARAAGRYVPGLGHPGPQGQRPAHARSCWRSRRRRACAGPHLRLYEAIGRVHPQVLGRTLPLNGAGVCGAALADLGPARRAAARVRPAGPRGRACSGSSRRSAAGRWRWMHDVVPGTRATGRLPRRRAGPRRADVPELSPTNDGDGEADGRAGRGHRLDPPPLLLQGEHGSTGRGRRRSRTSGSRKVEAFRETLTKARPDVLLHGRRRTTSTSSGSTTCRSSSSARRRAVRRQLVQRGARVRPAADAHARATEDLSGHILRGGLDAGLRPRVQQRAADSTTA